MQVTSSPELGAATPELAAPSPELAPGSADVVTGSPDVAMGLDDELVAPGELRPAAAAVVSTPVAPGPDDQPEGLSELDLDTAPTPAATGVAGEEGLPPEIDLKSTASMEAFTGFGDEAGSAPELDLAVTASMDAISGAGDEVGYPGDVAPQVTASRPTIPDQGDQMGYPRDVVPRAGLVARLSSGEGTELPHWADPPTGEVPRAITGPHGQDEELQAWKLLGARGLHWRDDVNDWSDGPGVEDLVDEGQRHSGMPAEGTGDPFSFDEDFERLEHERFGRGGNMSGRPDEFEPEIDLAALGPGVEAAGEGDDETRAMYGNDPARVGQPNAGETAGEGSEAYVDPAGGSDMNGGPSTVRPGVGTSRATAASRRRARRSGRVGVAEASAAVPNPARHTRISRPPYDARAENRAMGGPGRDLTAAIVTGVVLVGLLAICYLLGAVALLVLSAVAIFGCALEAFSMFQQAGFRPATLLGLLGSAGVVVAAYWRGTEALPVVIAVVVCASLVWYLARVVEARPLVNVAVTVLGFAWVGILGSFAGLLLAAHHGSHLFIGAVVPTVVADLVAWFAGSQFGSHPLAPAYSPSKTWEGAIAGGIAALVAGAIIGHQLSPWGGLRHGLELGLVVAVVAPVGDLVQSMLKRDLGVKDAGTLLPGHGGLLDRFDSLLFVLPAVYFLAIALQIVS